MAWLYLSEAKNLFACLRVTSRMYSLSLRALAALLGLALLASCAQRPAAETYVTGLNEPRGLSFDAAGDLLVAEAGAPDPPAAGAPPIVTNHSGRVLRIDARRQVTTLVDQLPFAHYADEGSDIGPADVAVISGTLYLLTGEGYDPMSRSVLRVAPNGSLQTVANFLSYAVANSLEARMMGANLAQANPYAMAAAPDGSALYVADGASGRVFRVGFDGYIRVFAELPDAPPLTGLAFGPDGRLYFTNFSHLPHTPGSGAIWAANPAGKLALAAGELTMPIDIAFDALGTMYVLEFSAGLKSDAPYGAGDGRLLRMDRFGARTVVIDELNYPTAMAFSPAGDLYIAVGGAFSGRGQGAVLRLPCATLGSPGACPAR
jgi:sugar lactone lactonase YvrE